MIRATKYKKERKCFIEQKSSNVLIDENKTKLIELIAEIKNIDEQFYSKLVCSIFQLELISTQKERELFFLRLLDKSVSSIPKKALITEVLTQIVLIYENNEVLTEQSKFARNVNAALAAEAKGGKSYE